MPAKKAVTKKVAVKTVKKAPVAKKAVVEKPAPVKKVEAGLTVQLFDSTGKAKGTVALPEAVFGGKINNVLMAQAVRVYLANQRMGAAKTKTRGEVDGSTRKIYRQKGTGRARHGGIRAPIFVGGGIAHGPRPKDYSLDLPVKMRRAALISALSVMAKNGKVSVVAGWDVLKKTKQAVTALSGMELAKKKALIVMPEYMSSVFKAVRNIDKVVVDTARGLTTYEVLNAGTVVVMQEALHVLEKQFTTGKQVQEKKESK